MRIGWDRWLITAALLSLMTASVALLVRARNASLIYQDPQAWEQPRVVSTVTPEYLGTIAEEGITGTVVVEPQVDSRGYVKSAHAMKGDQSLHKAFAGIFVELMHQPCVDAALQWRFTPSLDGISPRTLRVSFIFKTAQGKKKMPEIVSTYVSPYRLEVMYKRPKPSYIKYLPRVSGQVKRRVCTLHREVLKRDIVPIEYGEPAFESDYLWAWRTKFPESNKVYGGGCIVEEPARAEVLYCQRCRDAEDEWLKKHPRKTF